MSSQADRSGRVIALLGLVEDVTDPALDRRGVDANQLLFRTVIDAVPALIGVKDRDSRYVLVNARFADYHGKPPAWFEGRTIADFYERGYADEQVEVDRQVVLTRQSTGFAETSYAEPDGRVTHWLTNRVPVQDATGRVEYIVDVGLDITDIRQAQAAQRQTAELLRAVIDAVPATLNLKDLSGRYVLVNAHEAKLYGKPPDWFFGRQAADFLPGAYACQVTERDRLVIDSSKPLGWLDDQFIDDNGNASAWLATKLPLFDAAGKIQYVLSIGLDVTDRRRAEEELRASQRLLRTIIDAVPATISVKDLNGNYVLVNAYQAKYVGKATDWFVGKNAAELWPPDYLERLRERDREVVTTRSVQRYYEYDYEEMDGDVSSWMGNRSPILDRAGDVAYIVNVGLDITDLRRAERAVQESRALLQTVIDAVPAVVSVTDSEGRYVFVNAASARHHGHPAEWFSGKSLEDVHSAECAAILRERNRQVLSGEAVAGVYEEQFVERDQRVSTWLSTDVPLLDATGGPKYVVSVSLDISDWRRSETALKESEQRFRHLVESVSVVPYTWDVDNRRYLYLGPQVVSMFGYPLESWIDYRSWFSRIHPDDIGLVQRHALEFSSNPKDDELEYRIVAADGRVVWVRDVQKMQTKEDGARIGYGMYFDITASKLRDQQFAQSQRMEAIGKLTGGLAHDFNNLLTVVLGNLDLLEQATVDDPQQADRVRLAKAAVKRGSELNRRLLAFARRQVLEPQLADLNDVLSQLGELMRRTLGESIEIRMKLGDRVWPVRVDPAWLESTVLNLAINSRDAMPQGGILTIETGNRWLDQRHGGQNAEVIPGPYAMLAVSDTGVGMSPEILSQVFDPFFTTKEIGRGTGLGLSMVYGFVKQSGGHVRIESQPGRGTTVRIFLRRAEAGSDEAKLLASTADRNSEGTETILVVEDDASVRETAAAMLRSLGYDVLTASDGTAALQYLARNTQISVLVTDVVMTNGLNGPTLAREAARRVPGIGILLVSGYTEDVSFHDGPPGDRALWLGKPYSAMDLARKVRQLLDERSH